MYTPDEWFFCVAQYKVWVKPSQEQSFLYGNHVIKSGLARMTEGTPQYQGVVVNNMNDVPLVRLPPPPQTGAE